MLSRLHVALIAISAAAVFVVLFLQGTTLNNSALYSNISVIKLKTGHFYPEFQDRPVCSFDVYREHLRRVPDGYLGAVGKWTRDAGGHPVKFEPAICQFKYGPAVPQTEVLQCLKRTNISRVVVMGDSNGMRHFGAFNGLLHGDQRNAISCSHVKSDAIGGRGISVNYYASNTSRNIRVGERDCSGCCSRQYLCNVQMKSDNSTMKLIMEYIVLEFTIDARVTSFWSYNESHSLKPRVASTTSQQFLFKEYFAESGMPDLIIIVGNGHDAWRHTLAEHAMNIKHLLNIIDVYIPSTTRFVWTSKPAEVDVSGLRYERNYSIHDWYSVGNHLQYAAARERFLNRQNPLMFFDLQALLMPNLPFWNIDGQHMHGPWYAHIMSYVLQSLCDFK